MGVHVCFYDFFQKCNSYEGVYIGLGGGQPMYLFDDLGSHLQNLTPQISRDSTVAMAPMVFVQWSFVTFHCIFIPNPWCLSYHAYKPITIAQTWQLSSNGYSTNNLSWGYRCFRLTLVQNSSFTTRNELVETQPLLPFNIRPKLLQKEPTTCQEAAVPLLPFGTHPKLLHMKEAFPACTCTKLQYWYMIKRPSQLPVLLLQFYGRPDLLYRLEETELVYKIYMYYVYV